MISLSFKKNTVQNIWYTVAWISFPATVSLYRLPSFCNHTSLFQFFFQQKTLTDTINVLRKEGCFEGRGCDLNGFTGALEDRK